MVQNFGIGVFNGCFSKSWSISVACYIHKNGKLARVEWKSWLRLDEISQYITLISC